MRAARLNRAIRLAESGLAPFRQRFTRRMSMQSSRASPPPGQQVRVPLGGPECTVGGTIFEMWLGHH